MLLQQGTGTYRLAAAAGVRSEAGSGGGGGHWAQGHTGLLLPLVLDQRQEGGGGTLLQVGTRT